MLAPLERLRNAFWRVYQFSCDHPQYFALMFVDRSVPRVSREYERFASARRAQGRDDRPHPGSASTRAICPRRLPVSVAFRLLTVGLLGVATMRLSDRIGAEEHPDALARDVLDVTIAGLRSPVTLRSPSLACPLEPAADAHTP